jgi:integrase
MKASREQRVPLSKPAKEILRGLYKPGATGPVFLNARTSAPLSDMALLMTLRRIGRGVLTVHGFRSTFRDWAAEQTNHPREVAEAALAHTLTDKVEAAYRRGDLFEKRRKLMDAWARTCGAPTPSSNVAPLRKPRV